MKLFTMFSSDDRARSELAARRGDIAAVLKRIRGCREWGIRDDAGASAAPGARERSLPPSGTAFLTAKKRARDEARDRQRRAAEAAAATFAAWRGSRATRIAARRRANAATPPLVDAAFLVSGDRQARFEAAVEKAALMPAATPARRSMLTGPWPAYNFVQSTTERV